MLYHQALSGRTCELVPYDDDADLWQHPDTATTVRLPGHAPVPHDGAHGGLTDDDWYRVAITHRALHHELGTFELALDREESLFARSRPAGTWNGVPPLEGCLRHF